MSVSVSVGQVWEPLNAKGRRRLILCSGTKSGKNTITWFDNEGVESTVLFSTFISWIKSNSATVADYIE